MFSSGIFLNQCNERIASFGQFSVLSQLRCRLKLGKTDVRHRRWCDFSTLLFFYRDFFFYKGVVTEPGCAAEDDQRQQQHEEPLHDWQNVIETPSEIPERRRDRKSTRLNSSHDQISYAVFCLKKKTH